MKSNFYRGLVWSWASYNNGSSGTEGGGDPTSTPPTNGGGSNNNPPRTFTQAEVDSIVAKERKAEEAKRNKLVTELQQLQTSTRLSEDERTALAAQIEQLKNESLTTEQRLTRDLEQNKKKYTQDIEGLTVERDSWRSNYTDLLTDNQITAAAIKHEAFSTQQLLAVLKPQSKVTEILDGDGKGTGKYQVLIKFQDTDPKTKKPVTVELSPEDVVKRMRELPELYGNLFKSGVQRGLGNMRSDSGTTGEPDYSKMTPAEYREHRKQRGY